MPRRKKLDADGSTTTDKSPPGPTADLQQFVDRLERLETDKRDIAESINQVLQEAVDNGLHKKALRAVVKRRLESADEKVGREMFEDSLENMLARLGMLRDTPLGEAAAEVISRVRH
jgi:uncharacterized protein (UPF0335 family)